MDHQGIGEVHCGNVPVKTNANLFLFRNGNLLILILIDNGESHGYTAPSSCISRRFSLF